MELKLVREIFTDKSTIGKLYIDDNYECYTLEDKDRGLASSHTLGDINLHKQYGVMAIPYGTYEVVITYSNRFKQMMPLLLNVPGFDGIRIHVGNTDSDTHGCILVGKNRTETLGHVIVPDSIAQSRIEYDSLFGEITNACNNGKVFITIEKGDS